MFTEWVIKWHYWPMSYSFTQFQHILYYKVVLLAVTKRLSRMLIWFYRLSASYLMQLNCSSVWLSAYHLLSKYCKNSNYHDFSPNLRCSADFGLSSIGLNPQAFDRCHHHRLRRIRLIWATIPRPNNYFSSSKMGKNTCLC